MVQLTIAPSYLFVTLARPFGLTVTLSHCPIVKREVLVRWAQLRAQQTRICELRRTLRRRQVRVLWRLIRFQCLSVHHPDLQGLLRGFQVWSRNGIYDNQ